MSIARHNADDRRAASRRLVRCLLLALALACAWSTAVAGALVAVPGACAALPEGSALGVASFTGPGDGVPPDLLHHHVARKKARQTLLVPVARQHDDGGHEDAREALAALRPPSTAADPACGGNRATMSELQRIDAALPADPRLRLRPGQAPPSV